MTVTKAQLSDRRGSASIVRLRTPHPAWGDVVAVKDLMQRGSFDRPDRVGVGPRDRGVAFGVSLSDIAEIL